MRKQKPYETKTRIENGKKVVYEIWDESYEDDYGSPKWNFVPYRIQGKNKKRLSPETVLLTSWDAESYLRFGQYKTCKHCGSVYFKEED